MNRIALVLIAISIFYFVGLIYGTLLLGTLICYIIWRRSAGASTHHHDKILLAEVVSDKDGDKILLAEVVSDKDLFKQPPASDDCPICTLLLPTLDTGRKYFACCGNTICSGCIIANAMRGSERNMFSCAFCRAPIDSLEQHKRIKKRIEVEDSEAMYEFGCDCVHGAGLSRDVTKALKLWYRSAELGYAPAYYSIGTSYYNGTGVGKDTKKAKHYFELAALKGDVYARHSLGVIARDMGDIGRALKHFMIAAGCGSAPSLKDIQQMYKDGSVSKDDYTNALRGYQAYLKRIKSKQRDEAAAFRPKYKHY